MKTLRKFSFVLVPAIPVLLYLLGILLFTGCATAPRFTTPARFNATLPSGVQVAQSGDVAVPAKVETKAQTVEFTIPKDSVLSYQPKADTLQLTFSRDVPAVSKSTADVVTAPKPVPPPSPVEIAKATAVAGTVARFYWISLGLGALAAFLAYELHFKAAAVAGAGAVLVPMFARFLGNEAAQTCAIVVLAIAGALWAAWHFLKDRIESNPLVQKVETAIGAGVREVKAAAKSLEGPAAPA